MIDPFPHTFWRSEGFEMATARFCRGDVCIGSGLKAIGLGLQKTATISWKSGIDRQWGAG